MAADDEHQYGMRAGESFMNKPEVSENEYTIGRRLAAEFVGTAFLIASLVGSGIMGANMYAGQPMDGGVVLLAEGIAAWAMLFVIITVFGPVSGGHFNPAVTAMMFLRNAKDVKSPLHATLYIITQIVGGIAGCLAAHGFFNVEAVDEFDTGPDRDTYGHYAGEAASTFLLLTAILGCVRGEKEDQIPMSVAFVVLSGFWFTHSTSFANPAVTIGRAFTNTFGGINPMSVPGFLLGELVGLVVAVPFNAWLFDGLSPPAAMMVLLGSMRDGCGCLPVGDGGSREGADEETAAL